MALKVVEHPLAAHVLTGLRDAETDPGHFRHLAKTLATILILEATRTIRTTSKEVTTPLESTTTNVLGQGLAVVPILRAGLSMLEPALRLFNEVSVGYIGLERSHKTAIAASYYCKLPAMEGKFALCCDPMLATGGSATQAVSLLKSHGAKQIAMICVVAAPEGVAHFESVHPDVPIFTAALDRCLDENKYILPGLGDFGDRLYGTY